MTRKEVYDYLISKGCEQFAPNEYGMANTIGIRNPATSMETYFDTPINDKRMRDFTIGQLCSQLGIEIPSEVEHIKGIVEHIAKADFIRFSPKEQQSKGRLN